MSILESLEFSTPFIGSVIVLIIVCVLLGQLYKLLFSWLPRGAYNYLKGPLALLAIYIWAVPLGVGFYDFFK
jgi:hypothetical protein